MSVERKNWASRTCGSPVSCKETSGRAAEAVPHLRRGLELSPDRTDGLYLLAQALLRSGNTAEGREVLQRFRERKGREESIRVLESALNRQPDDLESRVQLTRLLIEHGAVGAAGLQLSTLLRLAPQDARLAELAAAIERQR